MDIFTATIFIVLFIVLIVFVFSMGLLTPIIGKKDIISVLVIGFIVGLVGGAFFISPIYQDLPYVVGSAQQTINGNNETMLIEVSPATDIKKLVTNLNKTEGVISVATKGAVLKTDPFSDERKKIIVEKVPNIDTHFKSVSVYKEGEIFINFTSGYDPKAAIKTLTEWLSYTGDINVKYSSIKVQITAKSANVQDITNYLHSENIVVSSVDGPVQNAINDTKNSMLDNNLVIFLSGIVGMIIALISIFFDNIVSWIRKLINSIKNR